MTNAVIIDDDEDNIKLLKLLIKGSNLPVNILGSSSTKQEAVELINQSHPNLIFMDINLDKDNTGFDVLDEADQFDAKVIFITSHDNYAIKAFDYNAVAYITKPIEKMDLILAVNKAVTEIKKEEFTQSNQIKSLRDALNQESFQIIAVPTVKDIELIKVKDIIYLSSDGGYTNFFLKGGKHIVSSKNLAKYEKLIQGSFYRIHAKYFVNLNFINKIHKDSGAAYCEMETGDLLSVSQRKYPDFMKFLNLK